MRSTPWTTDRTRPSTRSRRRAALAAGAALASMVGLLPAGTAGGALPGDNGLLAVEREGGGLFTIAPDGSGLSALSGSSATDGAPAWSPDGTRLAFHRFLPGSGQEIFVMDADGSDVAQLTDAPGQNTDPAWSPDGSRLSFVSSRDGDSEIFVMRSDGSDQTALTDNDARDFGPAWSPDGTQIAFTSDRESVNDEQVYVMGADGSDPVNISQDPDEARQPSWSPDGSRIAFASDRNGLAEIFVMRPDGTDQTQLTSTSDELHADPVWSPDGRQIAFTNFVNLSTAQLFVVDADGTDLRLVLVADDDVIRPDWQRLEPTDATSPDQGEGDGDPAAAEVGDPPLGDAGPTTTATPAAPLGRDPRFTG